MIKFCKSINGESILVSSILGERDKGIFTVCPVDKIIYIKFVSVDRFELRTTDGSLYFRAKVSKVKELLEGEFVSDDSSQVYFNHEYIRQIDTTKNEVLVSSFEDKCDFERMLIDNARKLVYEYRTHCLQNF